MSDSGVTDTPNTPDAGDVTTADAPRKSKRWQRIVSIILLVVGFILVPLSAVAIWAHNQLTNTDRYVETVSPLASNQDIQQAVAARVVTALFDQVDPAKRIENALPSRAGFLGEPIANAMESYATDVTEKLLATDQFQQLWDAINRRAHDQLVALLTDDPGRAHGAFKIDNGQVLLDLNPVIENVQKKLVDAGLSFLSDVKVPPVKRTIALINTEGLSEARSYMSLLDTLAWVLPVLGILALAGAALLVANRRRGTIRSALVLVAACALTLVLLAIARSLYLDAASSPGVNKDAASAVYDILIRNLRYGIIVLGLVGVIIALVAYFAGPSAPAKKARSLASSGISGARGKAEGMGYEPNALERFVGAHTRGIELGIGALAVVVLILWDRPGIGAVLFIAVVALLLVGVVEFLARGAQSTATPDNSSV